MMVMGFIGATSAPQLVSAILFFPLAVYFAWLVTPKRSHALVITVRPAESPKQVAQGPLAFDTNKRMFLKLIGSAGISLFLFSLFTKKAQAAFFGSVPGPGTVAVKDTSGAAIDPAIKHPTDGYKITELDDSSPAYYGFLEKTGKWFIMKEDSAGAYRYIKGDSAFSTNWTNRASLSYDYYDTIF